jgi:hypothetical protein
VALALVAWLAGAAAAVTVGLVALSTVGTGLFGPADPLAQAADTHASPGPDPDPAPEPTTEPTTGPSVGQDRTLTSPGGTVVARCIGDRAYLVLWSPGQGFHTDDAFRGPATVARVSFESRTREVNIKVTCVAGEPHSSIEDETNTGR